MEHIQSRFSLLAIERITIYENYIRIFAKTKSYPRHCSKCSSSCISKHGANNVRYADLPYENKAVFLDVQKKRFKCKSCSNTFFETIPYTLPFNRMTVFLAQYIFDRYKTMPFKTLSYLAKVDHKTIRHLMSHLSGDYSTFSEFLS